METHESESVERLTPLAIYWMAVNIEYLRLASENRWNAVFEDRSIEKRGKGYILKAMIDLCDLLKTYGLCQQEVKFLEDLIDEFKGYYTNENKPTQIIYDHAQELSKLIERIREDFLKELEGKQIFEVSPSGLLNYSLLLQKGLSALFTSEGIEEKLSDIIRNDLNEAVRALAYDIPTASAMISLRAVEGAIRELYKALKSQECRLRWKDALNEVEKELRNKGLESKSLEGYLDHFRNVRNEAEHPDRVFTRKEAEHILVHSAYAIEEIYKIIDKLTQSK